MKIIKSDKGNYSVRFKTASGKFVSRSLDTKNLTEARKLVKEAKIEELETAAKIKALQRDAVTSIIADANISYQDVVRDWFEFSKVRSKSENTIYTQSCLLDNFGRSTKIKRISNMTTKQISGWVNEPGDMSANSRSQRLSAINSLISYAIANGIILKDPAYGVAVDMSLLDHDKKEKKETIPFTEEEYHEMLKHEPGYFMRQAIALGWWTGLRIVDISLLEWASISETHLTVWTVKRDKRVQLPLDNPLIGGGELRKFLAEIEFQDKKYCFPEWAKLSKDPKKRSRFSTYFGRFLDRVGINEEGKYFHSFRHSFVSRIKAEDYNSSLEKIAKWVGHSRVETAKGYLHEIS